MSQAIEFALSQVKFKIPKAILQDAFKRTSYVGLPIPIQEVIKQEIIEDRILKECNIVAGPTKYLTMRDVFKIDMDPLEYEEQNFLNVRFYRIPQVLLDHQEITSVVSLNPPIGWHAGFAGDMCGTHQGANTISNKAAHMLASYIGASQVETPTATRISSDIIRAFPVTSIEGWILTVRLGYGKDFNQLNPEAIKSFAALVVAATKSFIYNALILNIGQVAAEGGVELGEYRTLVENYADAEGDYSTLLTDFQGGTILDDHTLKACLEFML